MHYQSLVLIVYVIFVQALVEGISRMFLLKGGILRMQALRELIITHRLSTVLNLGHKEMDLSIFLGTVKQIGIRHSV